MALLKCNECGKEVSDKATNCPNCGNPIEEIIKSTEKMSIIEKTGNGQPTKANINTVLDNILKMFAEEYYNDIISITKKENYGGQYYLLLKKLLMLKI